MTDRPISSRKLHDTLVELGLSEPEIDLYTSALTFGPSSVTRLAGHLRTSRRSLYKIIAALEGKGLIRRKKGRRYFNALTAESPYAILEKIRDKRDQYSELDRDLLSAMPGLLALHDRTSVAGLGRVRTIEGLQKLKILHDGILEEAAKEILFFGAVKDFMKLFPEEDYRRWLDYRLKKGIRVKALTPLESAVTRDHAAELREVRVLDGAQPFLTTFQLVANKLIFWQPKALYALVIEDDQFVEMMRMTFHALWMRAKPLKQVASTTNAA